MSPTPLSLLCALLLTLPLALVFTITHPTPTLPLPPPLPHPTPSPPRKTLTHFPKPITNHHNDHNLLSHLASRPNPNPSPATSPRKIAFMFLTTGALPLSPIWELFFNNTKTGNSNSTNLYNIYIHADPTLNHDLLFQGVFTNRTIPSIPTRRHSPSLAAAHRRLLAHALADDTENFMFCLVSPSCIPVRSFDFVYGTLVKSERSFVEILESERGAWGRWAARGEEVMLPEVPFESFRIGSQFSVLTRRHATLAVEDTRLWAKFKLPCLQENIHRCYPEENYLPTLLSMVDRKGCVPATLTYVDWKDHHDGHPHTFRRSEVSPELIRAIRQQRPRYGEEVVNGSDASATRRNDPLLFARKFGSDTVGALMEIAKEVILRD